MAAIRPAALADPTLILAASTTDSVSGSLFGISLFPWLSMLYFLGHPKTAAPRGVVFGLWYLLAFVFGSIPAAIFSERLFDASLADVDWLHGAAESLLAVTNCVVVLGFRDALRGTDRSLATGAWTLGVLAAATAALHVAVGAIDQHSAWLTVEPTRWYAAEPANALSLATWIIHTSSLVEWLVAMGLCWTFADACGVKEYKGITWGMLPLHTSGIVACTYHLFFNTVTWCVTLQALMTCFGNCTMALAAYRLASARGWTWDDVLPSFDRAPSPESRRDLGTRDDDTSLTPAGLPGWEDLGDAWSADSDVFFLFKVAALSVVSAVVVKAAPALLPDAALRHILEDPVDLQLLTLTIIILPTALNCLKWLKRSDQGFQGVF